jgi:hypothetical protein
MGVYYNNMRFMTDVHVRTAAVAAGRGSIDRGRGRRVACGGINLLECSNQGGHPVGYYAAAPKFRGFGACAVETWSRMPLRGIARRLRHGGAPRARAVRIWGFGACAIETWSRMPLRVFFFIMYWTSCIASRDPRPMVLNVKPPDSLLLIFAYKAPDCSQNQTVFSVSMQQ